MSQQLQQRLYLLKTEFEAGQKLLAEYEEKQRNLRETLLRISGAIQILEEVTAELTARRMAKCQIPTLAQPKWNYLVN